MKTLATLSLLLTLAPFVLASAPDNLVAAELISGTTGVEPGKPFVIGLRLHVADGWHVYWTNPGDAGAATTLSITAPDGFTVGPVEYPVPEKLAQPGGLWVYAYDKELLLRVKITPPANLGSVTSVPISAKAGWCVCSDVCVIGKKPLNLSLPVVQSDQSHPDNADLFAAWADRMPLTSNQAFTTVKPMINLSSSIGSYDGWIEFTWRAAPPAADFQWLPGPSDDLTVDTIESHTTGTVTSVRLRIHPIKGISPTSSTVSGILAYHTEGQPARGVAVELDRHALGLAEAK